MMIDDDGGKSSTGHPASESQGELEPSKLQQAFAFWGVTALLTCKHVETRFLNLSGINFILVHHMTVSYLTRKVVNYDKSTPHVLLFQVALSAGSTAETKEHICRVISA